MGRMYHQHGDKSMGEDDPKIGEELPDGRICAGLSPRTGKNMYVNGMDGGEPLTWEETKVAMKNLAPFGWRLPTKNEIEGNAEWANPGHGGWRCADESDSDPYRQRRLNAAFVRADSSRPVSSAESQRLTARAGGGLRSPDGGNPFPPRGEPKRGGPS